MGNFNRSQQPQQAPQFDPQVLALLQLLMGADQAYAPTAQQQPQIPSFANPLEEMNYWMSQPPSGQFIFTTDAHGRQIRWDVNAWKAQQAAMAHLMGYQPGDPDSNNDPTKPIAGQPGYGIPAQPDLRPPKIPDIAGPLTPGGPPSVLKQSGPSSVYNSMPDPSTRILGGVNGPGAMPNPWVPRKNKWGGR